MKKNKHITINLNIDEYNALLYIADKQQRNITNTAYLLLNENIKKCLLSLVDLSKNNDFKQMSFYE